MNADNAVSIVRAIDVLYFPPESPQELQSRSLHHEAKRMIEGLAPLYECFCGAGPIEIDTSDPELKSIKEEFAQQYLLLHSWYRDGNISLDNIRLSVNIRATLERMLDRLNPLYFLYLEAHLGATC